MFGENAVLDFVGKHAEVAREGLRLHRRHKAEQVFVAWPLSLLTALNVERQLLHGQHNNVPVAIRLHAQGW